MKCEKCNRQSHWLFKTKYLCDKHYLAIKKEDDRDQLQKEIRIIILGYMKRIIKKQDTDSIMDMISEINYVLRKYLINKIDI